MRPIWIAVGGLDLIGTLIIGLVVGGLLPLPSPAFAQHPDSLPKITKSAGVPQGVFGRDTRREPPAKYAELTKSVGQLETRVGSKFFLCTAFCVADNVVATAAHCLFEPEIRNHLSKTSIAIGQGPDRRVSAIHGRTPEEIQWSIIAGTTAVRTEGIPFNWAHDWALVRPAAPICKDRSLRVQTTGDHSTSWRKALEKDVFILGYHGDKGPRTLRYSDDCLSSDAPLEPDLARWLDTVVNLDSEDLLHHRCDFFRGASGAPVFLVDPNGPLAIGVANLFATKLPKVPVEYKELNEKAVTNRAVRASAFESKIALVRDAPALVSRDDLKIIQKALNEKGYYEGRITGAYDMGTRQAILDLERASDQPVTGRPTAQLVMAARAPDAIPSKPEPDRRDVFRSKGAIDRIIAGATKAIELDPKMARGYLSRSAAYLGLGNNDRAIADASKAIELDPKMAHGYLSRSAAYLGLGDNYRAIADASKAIELDPKMAHGYLNRALAYRNRGNAWNDKGDLDRAVADLDEAIRLDPKDAVALNIRGHVLEKNGQYDRAIADHTEAIRLHSKFAEAYNNRGVAYRNKKEYDRAIADYTKAIELAPKYALAYRNRGNAWNEKGELDRAIADASKAIELDPRFAEAYSVRGVAYFNKKEYDRTIADYTRAIELAPRFAEAYNDRGVAYRNKKEYDRAIADYTKAIELAPKYALAYRNRGNAWNDEGELDRAVADLDEANRLDPKDAVALNIRGHVLEKKGQYDRAIADHTEAIRLHPKYAAAYNNRAWAYFKVGKAAQGLPDVERSLELHPNYAAALDTRAHIYEALDRRDEAIADFRRALSLDPNKKGSADGLKRLGAAP
jgi:tetratricopeptide (TPR) repeat protein